MAYEPHTWEADELIAHEKLNHMETGIANSVPQTRTVNSKPLSSNITLSASDVSAVPTIRAVNGRELSSDITLTASDVNAVPTSRKINGKPLTSDITIESGGVGKSLAGQSVKPDSNTTETASDGAEIFNDYRKRAFSGNTVSTGNVASGYYSHAEGTKSTASGYGSHAEGEGTVASAFCSHAEGEGTVASASDSHAEGRRTTASTENSHAEGSDTTASGTDSHAEGHETVASGNQSHAEGNGTTAKGLCSHAAGADTIANSYQYVIGTYNVEKTTSGISGGDLFIIGNGWGTRSNGFRVNSSGSCYGSGAWNSSGADYAEMFEWSDKNPTNEDRRGFFVTLDGEHIRIAKPGDKNIIGIVSGNPTVLGDVYDDQWQGMYMTDVFGSPIWEDVEVPDWVEERPDPDNPSKTIIEVVIPAHTEHRQKLNPNYDNAQKYKARTERPEWAPVGLIGKLVAVDDGTCEPGEYCTVGYDDGVATASTEDTRYYVMSRIDNTHIRVFIMPR